MIYLDSAATANYSSKDDIIVDTIAEAMKKYWRNPSSLYASDVKSYIDICRKQVADFIGAKPDEIYFTSGSSESNNWAIRGWVDKELTEGTTVVNVITTPIEHKSILEAVKNPNLGAIVRYCDVDKYGLVDYNSLRRLLEFREGEPILVTVGSANNEIGTVQELEKISELVHKYDGVLHIDATQDLPYESINVKELGIDMMSASGHKISPVLKGIGFLYIKNGIKIHPLIYGSQERGVRGGTENVFGIIGLAKAIELCDVSQKRFDDMSTKRDYFISRLEHKFGCQLNGHDFLRLPNNVNVTFPQNITGESLMYTLETANILISTGSACNSKEMSPSHVLKAIGLTDDEAMRTVRFTLSDDITTEDIDKVIDEIDKTIKLIEV
jgi:cysteine desulfurase